MNSRTPDGQEPAAAEQAVDDEEEHVGVDVEHGAALERLHVEHGEAARRGEGHDELAVAHLLHRRETPPRRGRAGAW